MSRVELVASDYASVEGVYLLAFTRAGAHVPYGAGSSPYAGALHYLGWAEDIGRRLAEHAHGAGAHLTRAVRIAGYDMHLVRVWPGASRVEERQIKGCHQFARVCPWCLYKLAPLPSPAPALAALLYV